MFRLIPRSIAAALFGALFGPVCLVVAYGLNPDVTLPITDLPAATTSGFYAVEREGNRYFAWTARQAAVTLPGIDRRSEWSCSVRFRDARGPDMPSPRLDLAVDGVTLATRAVTHEPQDVSVTAPVRPARPGLVLTLTTSPPFVPGPSDPRSLGIEVEALGCRPVGSSVVLPPRRALRASALAAVPLGAALGLTGITPGSAVLATVLLAAAQSVPLSAGATPYTAYPVRTGVPLAAWVALLMVVATRLVEALNRQPLRNTARFVIVFSAGAVYLKLLSLLSPSKALVDAVFHAHRFDAVLAGQFYFTQLSTSATPFPYAIGLYAFAAPWALFSGDHVTLLRVVVCASDAIAGLLLYLMIVRTRGDRIMGAMAVALFNLLPVSYAIVGNANLTHAFGQAVALATVAVATAWPPEPRHRGRLAVLVLLAALGFMSHISTLVLLLATLAALGLLYRLSADRALHPAATRLGIATVAALGLAVVLYWGHFGAVYQAQIGRVQSTVTAKAPAVQGVAQQRAAASAHAPAATRDTVPLPSRTADAFAQTLGNAGWPILVLAFLGAWRLCMDGNRDRLLLAVAAWTVVGTALVATSVLTAVDARYQQDAWEFIGRVEHTTSPAAVILAAAGATWAWRAGGAIRVAACILLFAAVMTGVQAWTGWVI